MIPGIIAVLWFLAIMLCREWVKNDLRQKQLKPLRVRWRPFAYLLFCGFNVIYADLQGYIHRARCSTYWIRPTVFWQDDEVIDGSAPVASQRSAFSSGDE